MRPLLSPALLWKGLGIGALSLIVFAILLETPSVSAQNRRGWRGNYEVASPKRDIFPGDTFTFCRIRYTSTGYRGRGTWSTDYPASDRNFSQRLEELTTIRVNRKKANDRSGNPYEHVIVDLTDDALFDYPFIYMLEVGGLSFSDQEIERLREYLLRGGFLMVDDFWGEDEWQNWEYEISRVFDPDVYPMKEIDLDHPVFHMVFELDEKPQVPSLYHWYGTGGGTSERGAESRTPHYKGIYDPAQNNRLMVIVCHNTDLGDGWEREGESEGYFEAISSKWAYPLGINIVVYAMTH